MIRNYIFLGLLILVRLVPLILISGFTARRAAIFGIFRVVVGAAFGFPLFLAPPELVVLVVVVPSLFVFDDPSVVISAPVSRALLYLAEFRSIAHITLLTAGPVHVTAFTTLPVVRAKTENVCS